LHATGPREIVAVYSLNISYPGTETRTGAESVLEQASSSGSKISGVCELFVLLAKPFRKSHFQVFTPPIRNDVATYVFYSQ
jgi:hypothetical protein